MTTRDVQPMIRKTLILSTMHLDSPSMSWLSEFEITLPDGWFCWARTVGFTAGSDIPSSLRLILLYAIALDCKFILFDQDGEVNDVLPVYEPEHGVWQTDFDKFRD